MQILAISQDAKTIKGEKSGYLTGINYMAPSDFSGFNTCAQASEGCRKSCLGLYAGRANIIKIGEKTNTIRESRIAKTRLYFENRAMFLELLIKDIRKLIRKADKKGLVPVIRLNGSSDIPWERVPVTIHGTKYLNIMEAFPSIQFYDYTKITKRLPVFLSSTCPQNYHLTFSATEENYHDVNKVLARGGSVAIVFDKLPETYLGKPVINGDETDLRFSDPANVIVGLKAKGQAKHDTSGFVRRVA